MDASCFDLFFLSGNEKCKNPGRSKRQKERKTNTRFILIQKLA